MGSEAASPKFTAAQIAAALGVKPQAVRQRLAKVPSSPVPAGHQLAAAWSVESFPESLRADLEAVRVKAYDGVARYRSIADMLCPATTDEERQRAAEAARLRALDADAAALQIAALRRDVLAPALRVHLRTGRPLAGLAREACRHLADANGGKVPAQITVERWMRKALETAGANEKKLDDVALYLDKPASPAKSTSAGRPNLGSLALALAKWAEPENSAARLRQEAQLWNTAFHDAEALFAVFDHRAVIAAGVDLLGAVGSPFQGSNLAAIRRNWQRKWPVWRDHGKSPEALVDGRKENGPELAFSLTTEEKLVLRNLTLKKTFPIAIGLFYKHPVCSSENRRKILARLNEAAAAGKKPVWPMSVQQAAYCTAEEHARFRGVKAHQSLEHCSRRDLTMIDKSGARIPMRPGSLFESDDLSINTPFRWYDCDSKTWKVGRQSLCTLDVFSGRWLGFSLVGRPRDAYQSIDVTEAMLDIVDAHGLPEVWRLERGTWESSAVLGIKVAGHNERWGSLKRLFQVETVPKSRSKGAVESSFNFLQSLMAHDSTDIGRSRGEFEKAAKLYAAAQNGNPEALACFWDQDECANGMEQRMRDFNSSAKNRRAFGRTAVVPDDLWQGAVKRPLDPKDRWLFCSVKREAAVRQGHIECSVNHWAKSFRFACNGQTEHPEVYLEQNYPVLIAFSPARPEEGCYVFNAAEPGHRFNRERYAFGQFIVRARYVEDEPQVDHSRRIAEVFGERKRANSSTRNSFRAIAKAGAPAIRRTSERDGKGNRLDVTNHPAPSAAPSAETLESDALLARGVAMGYGNRKIETETAEQKQARSKSEELAEEEEYLRGQVRLSEADLEDWDSADRFLYEPSSSKEAAAQKLAEAEAKLKSFLESRQGVLSE